MDKKYNEILKQELIKNGLKFTNRVVIQPMEGCDCNEDGSPSELTVKKYLSFALSGAGLIWFEANSVCTEGRTNPRQMMLTKSNKEKFSTLINKIREVGKLKYGFSPKLILQLTHSGRQSIVPICGYHNSEYEKKKPITDENIASDEYLDGLSELFYNSALLAKEVGFDGVDVKSCHGYLLQEMLSAYSRSGKYGGCFENRFRLYKNCFDAVKVLESDNFIIATRFDPSDVIPKPNGFGTDENGNVVLDESKKILEYLYSNGCKLVNVTLGNPYYNPHVNRPFRKGGYIPPEKPEIGLQRFIDVESELKRSFPNIVFVGSGLSYYRENLIEKAEEQLKNNVCDLVGFGRESIAYPTFFVDYLNGCFDKNKTCLTCSKCTELMRAKQVSGCAVFNNYYRELYKEKVLCKK